MSPKEELKMAAVAQKVTIGVKEFQISAYQLDENGRSLLLFTHRQVGEIIGKTKATARHFLKKHAEELPPPIGVNRRFVSPSAACG